MLQLERRNDLMRILHERKSITVKELCAALYASPATVRRDLEALENEGVLKRSFGGAVLTETFPDELPLAVRAVAHVAEKKRIAAKAARFVLPGETVFIDGSSTTQFLVPHLAGVPEITVVTNSPLVCAALAEYRVRCLCTGGELLSGAMSLCGSDAERFVRGIRAHAVFFSARGAAGGTLTDSSKAVRDVKLAMIENSAKQYYLGDTSKNGLCYPYAVARLADLTAAVDEG